MHGSMAAWQAWQAWQACMLHRQAIAASKLSAQARHGFDAHNVPTRNLPSEVWETVPPSASTRARSEGKAAMCSLLSATNCSHKGAQTADKSEQRPQGTCGQQLQRRTQMHAHAACGCSTCRALLRAQGFESRCVVVTSSPRQSTQTQSPALATRTWPGALAWAGKHTAARAVHPESSAVAPARKPSLS